MTGHFLLETLAAWWLPMVTIGVVLGVQWTFWIMASSPFATTVQKSLTNENTMVSSIITTNDQGIQQETITAEELSSSSTEETSLSPSQQDLVAESSSLKEINSAKQGNSEDASNPTKKTRNSSNDDVGEDDDYEKDLFQKNDQWRCACEGGFLLPGMLKSFGSANAVMRLGAGQCYHKQM